MFLEKHIIIRMISEGSLDTKLI